MIIQILGLMVTNGMGCMWQGGGTLCSFELSRDDSVGEEIAVRESPGCKGRARLRERLHSSVS
jgi:hypothetical protein